MRFFAPRVFDGLLSLHNFTSGRLGVLSTFCLARLLLLLRSSFSIQGFFCCDHGLAFWIDTRSSFSFSLGYTSFHSFLLVRSLKVVRLLSVTGVNAAVHVAAPSWVVLTRLGVFDWLLATLLMHQRHCQRVFLMLRAPPGRGFACYEPVANVWRTLHAVALGVVLLDSCLFHRIGWVCSGMTVAGW